MKLNSIKAILAFFEIYNVAKRQIKKFKNRASSFGDWRHRRLTAKKICLSSEAEKYATHLRKFGYVKLRRDFFSDGLLKDLKKKSLEIYNGNFENIDSLLGQKGIRSLDKSVIVDRSDPLAQIALNKNLLDLINIVFGEVAILLSHQIFVSRNSSQETFGSQHWHLDDHDTNVLKLFIYITDVSDEGLGPFTLAEKSSELGRKFKYSFGHITDEKLAKLGIVSKPIPILGKELSCFIVNTGKCPHFGSVGMRQDRIVTTATYVSNSAWNKGIRNIKVQPNSEIESLMLA